MDIRNKSSGLEKYSIWRVRLEKLCSHYIFTRHIIKLRRRPPVAPGTDSCSLEVFGEQDLALYPFHRPGAQQAAEMKYDPSD